MPTENSPSGRGTGDYDSLNERLLHEKSKGVILSIKPTTEKDARDLLGLCNEYDVDQEIIEHFAEEVRRLA
jgi:hypothetical protein